jgi:uncharacterized protein (DUF305 family)
MLKMKNKLHTFRALCVVSCLAWSCSPAMTQAQQPASMPGMDMSASADGSSGDSTSAYKDADARMMKDMSAPPFTGNADKDFVARMIPHHQGAIEMAQVELKYGKDAELKRLAKNIIKAQHDEIAFMQRWQAKHGVK